MTDLLYVEDLKIALSELGEIEEELDTLSNKKQILRDKIRQWMDINSIANFQIELQDGEFWKLTINNSERKSANYEYLESILTKPQYSEAIKISSYETFKCQPVKTIKSKYSRKSAPKGN